MDKSLCLPVIPFCPNLKRFSTKFRNDESNMLRNILDGCQYLESIKVLCGNHYLSEKDMLEAVVKYSPKSFHELSIHNCGVSPEPEDLESFFLSWQNRLQKPLTLIVVDDRNYGLRANERNITIIEKYESENTIYKLSYIY